MKPLSPIELSDVIGGAPQGSAKVMPMRLDNPERDLANARRLQQLRDEEAFAIERAAKTAKRTKALVQAAQDEGRRMGYRQGHIDGTHWGILVGFISGALVAGIVAGLYLGTRAGGLL